MEWGGKRLHQRASPPFPALHDEADHLGRRLEMFARDDLVHLDRRIEGAGQGHVLDHRHAAFPGQFANTQGHRVHALGDADRGAVALRYEPDKGDGAPVCVAKGVDALALRIREVAREHGVPVVENVPLARALYAKVEVDAVIPREHFEAAAKVIGFVMQGRKRR